MVGSFDGHPEDWLRKVSGNSTVLVVESGGPLPTPVPTSSVTSSAHGSVVSSQKNPLPAPCSFRRSWEGKGASPEPEGSKNAGTETSVRFFLAEASEMGTWVGSQ